MLQICDIVMNLVYVPFPLLYVPFSPLFLRLVVVSPNLLSVRPKTRGIGARHVLWPWRFASIAIPVIISSALMITVTTCDYRHSRYAVALCLHSPPYVLRQPP